MVADERDTIFARMALSRGSSSFEEYYSNKPDKLMVDEMLRNLPDLGSHQSPTYDHPGSAITAAIFRMLSGLIPMSMGEPKNPPVEENPERLTRWVKGAALYLGADDAGVASTRRGTYYSHQGRREDVWGKTVEENHPFGVALISSMDPSMIHKGPLAPVMAESARAYLRSGIAAIALAYAIREMGFQARAHTDGNYLVVAPRVAADAGLGVFGRSGLLVHRTFGPCARISVVTTDMPLLPGSPDPLASAVETFCKVCGRCSVHCPGKAIPEGDPEKGALNPWVLDPERCYAAWRRMGTDCGVCISTCPFTTGIDWGDLERAGTDTDAHEKILLGAGGKDKPRPFDPEPPLWWR